MKRIFAGRKPWRVPREPGWSRDCRAPTAEKDSCLKPQRVRKCCGCVEKSFENCQECAVRPSDHRSEKPYHRHQVFFIIFLLKPFCNFIFNIRLKFYYNNKPDYYLKYSLPFYFIILFSPALTTWDLCLRLENNPGAPSPGEEAGARATPAPDRRRHPTLGRPDVFF